MSDDSPSLQSFFFPEEGTEGPNPLENDSEAWDELATSLQKELPKVAWKVVGREIKAKLGEVLGARVSEVLGSGWQKLETLQEYRDTELHPRGETALVPLAEHTIESHHHPHVDIVVRELEVGSVKLDVTLKLHLEGVLLKIEDGRIQEIRGGSCVGEGDLEATVTTKLGSKSLCDLHREMPAVELGKVSWGGSIEIPDLSKVVEVAKLAS